MDGPRRPAWEAAVRVAPAVQLQLDGPTAWASLAAVHEARRLLGDVVDGERAALLDALSALERELGLALGADAARSFLRRRARRRARSAG
jgi:hypothetical protein